MKLAIIVAAARNGVIGRNNQLPWHLPQDLKYFKAVTLGKPVIMGRKTYESIGRPLPGRTNIVVTRDHSWSAEGVEVVHGFEEALAVAQGSNAAEVMVIGGAEIYKEALPLAQRIYLTQIEASPEGDAYFAIPAQAGWVLVSQIEGAAEAPVQHNFLIYDCLKENSGDK